MINISKKYKNLKKDIQNCTLNELFEYDSSGDNIMHKAIKMQNFKVLKLLLDKGMNPNQVAEQGHSPLHIAIMQRDMKAIKILLKSSMTDVNCIANHEQTPLHYTIEYISKQSITIIGILQRYGANIDAPDEFGATPLRYAVDNHYYDIVQCLLDYGASIQAKDVNGLSVFEIVNQSEDTELKEICSKYIGD